MNSRKWRLCAAPLAVFLLLAGPARAADPPPVLVFAASSIADVVEEIGTAFGKKTGFAVRVSSGGSGMLAQQISRGAPADIFISAGASAMGPLRMKSLIDDGSTFPWITNTLVVVAPSDRAAPLKSPSEIAGENVRRLAIGDPESVPVGSYAQEALMALGLWEKVRDRALRAPDARTALAYVGSGEADLGIVYATDARSSDRVKVVLRLEGERLPKILYPAALISNPGRSPGTPEFLKFLRSPEARRILIASGFNPAFP